MTETNTHEPASIRTWLVERVAYYVETTADQIDPDQQLQDLGIDSVYALTLCGDVEDAFGLIVEPTLTWDYPTINALVGYLSKELVATP